MVGTLKSVTRLSTWKQKQFIIDTDPAQIGKRYATDIGLAGDSWYKQLRW